MKRKTDLYPIKITDILKASIFAKYKAVLKPFGANHRALRIYTGMSAESLKSDLMTKQNFKTSSESIILVENNQLDEYKSYSIKYLIHLCEYWGVEFIDMLTIDYSIESNLPEHIKVRKKYNKALISSYTLYHKNTSIPFLNSFVSIPVKS